MPTPTQPDRSITLPCPRCGDGDASIAVSLSHLAPGDDTFHCHNCDQDFGITEVRDLVRRWAPILRWLDAIPAAEDE